MDSSVQAIMTDPVVLLADGQSYERAAIKQWLKDHNTSPVTGASLHGQKEVTPNHLLRNIIQACQHQAQSCELGSCCN